ncbi:uncharacterized protein LOC135530414 [Oncorhynchus masou masou]|uniref:uncharacterized protein LOC135530414 n=1 Tax=Oncorhynchus masou masou TaxID=90313 RepID=UPI003182DE7A
MINNFRQGRVFVNSPDTASVIGFSKKVLSFIPVTELKAQTDFEHRMPKVQWWQNLHQILKMLAKHQTSFSEIRPWRDRTCDPTFSQHRHWLLEHILTLDCRHRLLEHILTLDCRHRLLEHILTLDCRHRLLEHILTLDCRHWLLEHILTLDCRHRLLEHILTLDCRHRLLEHILTLDCRHRLLEHILTLDCRHRLLNTGLQPWNVTPNLFVFPVYLKRGPYICTVSETT